MFKKAFAKIHYQVNQIKPHKDSELNGYLYKFNEDKWKLYFFKLTSEKLMYQSAATHWSCSNIGIIGTKRVQDDNQKYRFFIVTQQGTLDLAASSEEQLLDWITAIDLILADNHAKNPQNATRARKPSDVAKPIIPINSEYEAQKTSPLSENKIDKKKGILRSNTSKDSKKKEEVADKKSQVQKSLGDLNKIPDKPILDFSPNSKVDFDRPRNQSAEPNKQRYSSWGENTMYPDYQSDFGGYVPIQPRMQLYDMYGNPVPQMFYQDYSQMNPEEYYRMRGMRYDYPHEVDPRYFREDPRMRPDFDNRYSYMEDPRMLQREGSRYGQREDPRYMSMKTERIPDRLPEMDPRIAQEQYLSMKSQKPTEANRRMSQNIQDTSYLSMQPDARYQREYKPLDIDPRKDLRYGTDPRYTDPKIIDTDPRINLDQRLAKNDNRYPKDQKTVEFDSRVADPRYMSMKPDLRYKELLELDARKVQDIRYSTMQADPRYIKEPLESRDPRYTINVPQQRQNQMDRERSPIDSTRKEISPLSDGFRRRGPDGYPDPNYIPSYGHSTVEKRSERNSAEKINVNPQRASQYELHLQRGETAPDIDEVITLSQNMKQSEISDEDQTLGGQKKVRNKSLVRRSQSVKQATERVTSMSLKQQEQLERIQSIASSNDKDRRLDLVKNAESPKVSNSTGNLKSPTGVEKVDLVPRNSNSKPKKAEYQIEKILERPKSISFADSTPSEDHDIVNKKKLSVNKKPASEIGSPVVPRKLTSLEELDQKETIKSDSLVRGKSKNKHSETSNNEKSKVKSGLAVEIDQAELEKHELAKSSSQNLSTISASIDIDPHDGKIKKSQMINPEISHAFFDGGIEPEILDASQDLSISTTLTRAHRSHEDKIDAPKKAQEPIRLRSKSNKRPYVARS